MAQIGRTKLVVIFIALLVGCNHRVNKVSIEGDFVAISTAVFLTDGEEEKADQFNKCVPGSIVFWPINYMQILPVSYSIV